MSAARQRDGEAAPARAPVSLVCATYQEATSIEAFLASYRAQTRYAEELIVVDGDSPDGTAEIVARYAAAHPELAITLVVEPRCGRGRSPGPIALARNIAIERARCQHIAVSDAGCRLDPRWLAEISWPLGDRNIDVVAGWYELARPRSAFGEAYAACYMLGLDEVDSSFLPSARSVAFRKRCWQAVGGYPTRTLTAEDTYFALALQRRGYRCVFNPAALVHWDGPATLGAAMRKHYGYAYGDARLGLYRRLYAVKMLTLALPLTVLLSPARRRYPLTAYAVFLAEQAGFAAGSLAQLRRWLKAGESARAPGRADPPAPG